MIIASGYVTENLHAEFQIFLANFPHRVLVSFVQSVILTRSQLITGPPLEIQIEGCKTSNFKNLSVIQGKLRGAIASL